MTPLITLISALNCGSDRLNFAKRALKSSIIVWRSCPGTVRISISTVHLSGMTFVAWPPAGNVPITAARGRWSLAFVGGRNVTDRTEIEVAVDGGAPEAVNWAVIPGGFGSASPTLGWDMPASVYRHGATVEVTARNLNDGDLSYTLRFTDCGG